MMKIELTDEPAGKVREYISVFSRFVIDGKWSKWVRLGTFANMTTATASMESEAKRDGSFGGLLAPTGPRQFRVSKTVETTVECWDTSAKKIEPTKRRKRA